MHGVEVIPPRKEPIPGEKLNRPEVGVFPPDKPSDPVLDNERSNEGSATGGAIPVRPETTK